MTIEKAIEVLEYHNQWRRGAEILPQSPKEIGIAIETVLGALRKPSETCDLCDERGNYIELRWVCPKCRMNCGE